MLNFTAIFNILYMVESEEVFQEGEHMHPEITVRTAGVIDQTQLQPDASINDIEAFCETASEYPFAAVCVYPVWVQSACSILEGTGIAVCSVAGFPSGAHRTDIKIMEAQKAVTDGATEIDAVMNVGFLKHRLRAECKNEMKALARVCHDNGAIVKIIIETCMLSQEEKEEAAAMVIESGCDFIKTSTGFGSAGALPQDVEMLSRIAAGTGVRIKAAGGIHSLDDLVVMTKAGAHRIGTSRGMAIVQETLKKRTDREM